MCSRPDEVRIQPSDAAGGGHRAVTPGQDSRRGGTFIEPLFRDLTRGNGGIQDLVVVILDDFVQLNAEPGILAEMCQNFQQAREQARARLEVTGLDTRDTEP
jgi:hypothetical protein